MCVYQSARFVAFLMKMYKILFQITIAARLWSLHNLLRPFLVFLIFRQQYSRNQDMKNNCINTCFAQNTFTIILQSTCTDNILQLLSLCFLLSILHFVVYFDKKYVTKWKCPLPPSVIISLFITLICLFILTFLIKKKYILFSHIWKNILQKV